MLPLRFFISYTSSWIVFILIGLGLNKIEIISNSILIKLSILMITIFVLSKFLFKQLPKTNIDNVSKSKFIFIIIAFEVGYIILRGLIPDQVLPHTLVIGFILRYLYSVIILSILFKTKKSI